MSMNYLYRRVQGTVVRVQKGIQGLFMQTNSVSYSNSLKGERLERPH